MMHVSDEDGEFCSINRFGSIETELRTKKEHKNNQKIRKVRVQFAVTNRINSIEFDLIRNSL